MTRRRHAKIDKIVSPTIENIRRAAGILKDGGLVAFPTETVYGLGANALNPDAVSKIFEAKGRPQDNPLILHISGIMDATKYAVIGETAESLMQQFWPGPLTIVLAASDIVPRVTRANLDTVALRAPLNQVALNLIRETGLPIAAPSANRSGRPSPTTARAVYDDLGDSVDLIIDGGSTKIGVESTVVDATDSSIAILRPGGVTREMLSRIVDICVDPYDELKKRSPGTTHRHYAPAIPLKLWSGPDEDVFIMTGEDKWCYIGMRQPPEGAFTARLFPSMEKYAKGLFSAMREMETSGSDMIIADLPDDEDLGSAVRNRLLRAAETK